MTAHQQLLDNLTNTGLVEHAHDVVTELAARISVAKPEMLAEQLAQATTVIELADAMSSAATILINNSTTSGGSEMQVRTKNLRDLESATKAFDEALASFNPDEWEPEP